MINEDEIIEKMLLINEDEEININENKETEYITAELVRLLNYFPNNCCML